MADIAEQVEQAVESFDLEEFITANTAVPTDTVTVYTDTQTAYEIEALKREHEEAVQRSGKGGPKGIADEADPILEEYEDRVEALQEKIKSSALTLHMRAVNEAERKVLVKKVFKDIKISKNASEEERGEKEIQREDETFIAWYSASVTKIVRPDGAVVSDVKPEHLRALKTALYDSEWIKIAQKFESLSFAAHLVDKAVDAGFRSGAAS